MNYHTHLHHHHVVSMRKLKDHDKKVNITIQKEKIDIKRKIEKPLQKAIGFRI